MYERVWGARPARPLRNRQDACATRGQICCGVSRPPLPEGATGKMPVPPDIFLWDGRPARPKSYLKLTKQFFVIQNSRPILVC